MKLTDKARELKNAYQRDWKKRNPDKVRKHINDYWERQAAKYTPEIKARELRSLGLSQREIAHRLNISLGTVNKYLKA